MDQRLCLFQVGVDPLLRYKIWDYLVDMTLKQNATVLLSTHYIEEARQSNFVGLMRNGVLVAEDSPQNVVQIMGASHLEEAFLKLAQMQEHDDVNQNLSNNIEELETIPNDSRPSKLCRRTTNSATTKNVLHRSVYKIFHALLIKNFLVVFRNAE